MLKILFYQAFFIYFFLFDLYFLITAVIAQLFNPTAELAVPIEILTSEVKAEIETQLVIAESNKSNCSMYYEAVNVFVLLTH